MSEATETVNFEKSEFLVFSIGDYPPSKIQTSPPPSLILIGPGNPGFVTPYKTFARILHEKLQLPVWVHSFVEHGTAKPFNKIEPKHRLPNQIEMKKHLIRHYLSTVRIICVDHSTSCYITLQILGDAVLGPRIAEAYFLMPVISKPDTINGSVIHWTVNSRIALAAVEAYVFIYNRLSNSWQNWIDKTYYRWNGYKNVPDFPITTPGMVRKVFTLGSDLFEVKLDVEPVIQFSDRLHLFCSEEDELLGSWVYVLKSRNLAIDMKHHNSVRHVFFIDESETMGGIVADWINETADKKKHDFCKFLEI